MVLNLFVLDPLPASRILYLTVSGFSALYVGWLSLARSLAFLHFPSKMISSSFTHLFQTHHYHEPPHGKFVDVKLHTAKCHKEIQNLRSKPLRQSNLTCTEEMALQSLRSKKDIIMKPAHKGAAMVVWDHYLYITEAHRQLDDNSSYQSLPIPSLPQDQKNISGSVNKLINNEDLPSTAKLLIKSQAKQPTFYLLLKIHKLNTPGRPIISACSCPSENISEYLDSLLLPVVQSLPTYIKDTTHALTIFEQINTAQNFQPQLLFTMDVVLLYTSIPHADGLRALSFFLDHCPPEARYPSTITLV